MPSRWRDFFGVVLPWYEPTRERQHNAKTEALVRRSEVARLRAERVIAEYRAAEKASDRAGEAMVNEVRRDDR